MNKKSLLAIAALVLLFLAGFSWRYFQRPDPVATGSLEAAPPAVGTFERVTGPVALVFPQDFGAHENTQTEWWYFTGNLDSADGRRYGFQLTFFRRGLVGPNALEQRTSGWAADQVYLAHFALTDIDKGRFYQFEQTERGAAGLAGAVGAQGFQVWLRDWSVEQAGDGVYHLRAAKNGVGLDLMLRDEKGPILQGDRGYSQKGPEAGNASVYVSLTRLRSDGTLTLDGKQLDVLGSTWMDHEYGTSALGKDQVGWDWFSIQLDNHQELMVYQLRKSDGTIDAFSRGVIVDSSGAVTVLSGDDFKIAVNSQWKSPHSGGLYPASWTVTVPSQRLTLQIKPFLSDQELNNSFVYWEGAVAIEGDIAGEAVRGRGYTELTGYARSFGGGF